MQTKNPYYPLYIACILVPIIYLNYWHHLERNYIYLSEYRFVRYYLLYLIPFAGAFLLQGKAQTKKVWVIILLAPAIFAIRASVDLHAGIEGNLIVRALMLIVPVIVIWFVRDRNQPLYGIAKTGDLSPYFILLLAIIPFLLIASRQPDFMHAYPRAKAASNVTLFEFCYGFDFLSIEFFFRGFLILALPRAAIVPVACFYCMIHLNKPIAEAISSFFGGVLLGVVIYRSKSIWGGLFLHLGIAYTMEILGFLNS